MTYLAQALGHQRELRLHPFQHGWVITPKPAETPVGQNRLQGQPKLVLDKNTRKILEFPSWAVPTVAEEYTKAIQAGTPLPGRQIYPHRTRMTLTLMQETPTNMEYRIHIASLDNSEETTADYNLTIDKQTLRYHPPDHESARATSWIAMRRNTPGAWPTEGSIYY